MANLKNIILILSISCLFIVNSENIEPKKCPEECKKPVLTSDEASKCVSLCRPKETDELNESCVKDCIFKNPEAPELCTLRCHLDSKVKEEKEKEEKKDGEKQKEEEKGEDFDIFSNTIYKVHNYMNKMMDCMMDGVNHQKKFGFMRNFFDGEFPSAGKKSEKKEEEEEMDESIKIKKEIEKNKDSIIKKEVEENIDKSIEKINKKDEEKKGEEPLPPINTFFRLPLVHRFIIFKKLSPLNNNEKENEKIEEKQESEFSLPRLFFRIYSTNDEKIIPDNQQPNNHHDNHQNKSPNNNIVSFFHKSSSSSSSSTFCNAFNFHCNWRKSLLFICIFILFLSSTWYCLISLLALKRKRLVQKQEALLRSNSEDFDYLIPIDEKILLVSKDNLMNINEGVDLNSQAPPLPEKKIIDA